MRWTSQMTPSFYWSSIKQTRNQGLFPVMSSMFSGFLPLSGPEQRPGPKFPTQVLLMAEESESVVLHLRSEVAKSAGLELTQVPVLCIRATNMPCSHLYRKALATYTYVLLLLRYNRSPSGLWQIPAGAKDFHKAPGPCRRKTFPQRLLLISDIAKHYQLSYR